MKLWKTAVVDQKLVSSLAGETGLPAPAVAVLVARNKKDPESIERFLNPRLSDLSDPFLMPDMRKATDRIWDAIERKEQIVIYGDYDVDGVTGTALLVKVLTQLGATVAPFLPKRLDEGYGLTPDGLKRCLETCNPKVIVTVDCGTNSGAEVRIASDAGVDVIVTDHHETAGRLAGVIALVNPELGDDESTADLAGVGVAFKMCHALVKHGIDRSKRETSGIDLRNYLDLVALGTVADIVPLVGENRILTHHGLTRLNRTESPGLNALMDVSGIAEQDVGCYHIGFVLGPRLNAAGRLSSAEHALELLLTNDTDRAREIARDLDKANRERKRLEDIIVTEAIKEIDGYFDRKKDFGLVTGRDGWHAGTIGIAASRLCSRYYRPAAVVAFGEDGYGRGSCRSIEMLDVVEALRGCADLLTSFGGHKMAAGFQIEKSKFDLFRSRFNELCARQLKGCDLRPVQNIDAWISIGEADERLFDAIRKMRPFGVGNPTPVWGAEGVQVLGQPRVLKEAHLKMKLASGGTQMDAIAFGMGDKEVPEGTLDIAFQLEENIYMNRRSLQLNIKDFHASESGAA